MKADPGTQANFYYSSDGGITWDESDSDGNPWYMIPYIAGDKLFLTRIGGTGTYQSVGGSDGSQIALVSHNYGESFEWVNITGYTTAVSKYANNVVYADGFYWMTWGALVSSNTPRMGIAKSSDGINFVNQTITGVGNASAGLRRNTGLAYSDELGFVTNEYISNDGINWTEKLPGFTIASKLYDINGIIFSTPSNPSSVTNTFGIYDGEWNMTGFDGSSPSILDNKADFIIEAYERYWFIRSYATSPINSNGDYNGGDGGSELMFSLVNNLSGEFTGYVSENTITAKAVNSDNELIFTEFDPDTEITSLSKLVYL